jgi:hypothetical protein
VNVDNPIDSCPLCFSSLTQKDNNPEQSSYPALLQQAERQSILIRVLVMLSFAVSVVSLTVNILTYNGLLWSLIVIGNVLYIWAAISTAVRKRSRIGFNVLIQVLCLAGLLVIIDVFSGRGNWALNYVVPFLFITATMSITVITIVKRLDTRSFILYFFLIALLGFIPIFLLALDQATVLWPSLVSAIYSGLSLLSLFVFAYRATKQELQKRFHM